ncbi:hypothetical protein [Endozoicomonas arenosclerae]|uniref:hypothetical protein n=1 Tax=Endozoicomonas arenosclerae TaxID=1633495 RepID=UPI00078547C4|nr:hypothetical protein [Endozoicomonas arenosclerae]
MRKVSYFPVILLLLFLAGCTEHTTSEYSAIGLTPTNHGAVNEQLAIVSGVIVEEMKQGTDGSVWKFRANDGAIYALVVSIPNLGPQESENIDIIKPGAQVRIIGDSYKLGNERRLIAREIAVHSD